jgi:ceramide glucosyltransferase
MGMSLLLFAASAAGLCALAAQLVALRRHLRRDGSRRATLALRRRRERAAEEGISVLKPLCGADDDLERNLETFARLDHPRYEVLLGLRDLRDPACPLAYAAAARWPGVFRVVLQGGEPGLNPKVNQLVTLARAARHDVLVVSDSNVRVAAGYLLEIAAHLRDERVGLVTHPVVGVGERSLGAALENLHLAGSVAPGVVAAKRLAGRDVVVGKSMAFRRRDLEALGGFESAKDVLAEDYVLGVRVSRELGKRVAIGETPVENVNQRRTVSAFLARYDRWCVMQRKIVGSPVYASQALLNPVALGVAAALADPGPASAALLASICAAKAALDGASARALRPGGFRPWQLALVPAKDLLFAWSFLRGFFRSTVEWRGHRLRVLAGSRLALPGAPEIPAHLPGTPSPGGAATGRHPIAA